MILKKELKAFFTNKGNLVFMFFLPILLISIFSFALGDYVKAEYGTFNGGRVLFIDEGVSPEMSEKFARIKEQISDATGVVFEQVTDIPTAKKQVESSEAFGLITVTGQGFDYFRSEFNEPEGAKTVRSLFLQMAEGNISNTASQKIQHITLKADRPDAKKYYTFSGLAFSILFMGLLVAHSVFDEKAYGTITRIQLSRAGIGVMLLCKVLTGILCGSVQILSAFVFSSLVLGVKWGGKTALIFLLLLMLVLYSAVFGAVVGNLAKNKSMCQSAVLMVSMLCGYLGGSVTPLYLLENMPVLNIIIKLSPLYHLNRAVTALSNGILDRSTFYTVLVLTGLSVFMLVLFMLTRNKTNAGKETAA
ncbi:MAG: ABC transporter permease [Oscillospiraceae bacterium]|nr:ABC transporter permease [Oscillospiraceae bacterium]